MKLVMQIRCIYCKVEQYAMAVWDISHGDCGCSWCGKVPPVFTDEKLYWETVNKDEQQD